MRSAPRCAALSRVLSVEVGKVMAVTARGRVAQRLRRAELLQTAARVFQENGYVPASVKDLAEAMGFLSTSSLYYYMRSKEDLLVDILFGEYQQSVRQLAGEDHRRQRSSNDPGVCYHARRAQQRWRAGQRRDTSARDALPKPRTTTPHHRCARRLRARSERRHSERPGGGRSVRGPRPWAYRSHSPRDDDRDLWLAVATRGRVDVRGSMGDR